MIILDAKFTTMDSIERLARKYTRNGNLAELEKLFKTHGESLSSTKDEEGNTLLHLAIKQIHTEASSRCEKNLQAEPLLAEMRHHFDTLIFVARHVDKTIKNQYGKACGRLLFQNVRLFGIIKENDELLSDLFDTVLTREELNDGCFYLGRTLLHILIREQLWGAVRAAMNKTPDLTKTDIIKNTYLHLAVVSDNIPLDILDRLLLADVVNGQNNNGVAPLHFHVFHMYPNPVVIRKLLDAGASLDLGDNAGDFPIDKYMFHHAPQLNTDIFTLLLPQDRIHLSYTFIQLVSLSFKFRTNEVTGLKDIIRLLILHMQPIRWNNVTFQQISSHSRNFQLMVDSQHFLKRFSLSLAQAEVITFCLTQLGYRISSTTPDLFSISPDDNEVGQKVVDNINRMWREYREQPVSLFHQCCEVVRSNVQLPLNRERLDKLQLPRDITERIARTDIADAVLDKLKSVSSSW